MPLRAAGFSKSRAFWYGQLSGLVEPIFGVLGCLLVSYAQPILPYALAFAAGAMVFVVLDDIVPESQVCGNGKTSSWAAIIGFIIMMALEVGLQ
ncbi:zinc transporter ZIP11-like [Tropilaelaps mercedesae]|uniref:Zinc transporter ZIP11-like n=1 Tax=Tropilaelaps mercedesae TaxID=418985 RepID=A0A1V9XVT1_9ACAR|nr:zinc transporter ZIP11-like [Tropilaelaps mercedesae]